jgi:hypothetical protein
MQDVITFELAAQLQEAGLGWDPSSGDRFAVPDRDLDDQVFVISEMTIEPHQLESGGIVRFNGTTEWALDSVDKADVLWLPREEQLRELLGADFRRLEAVPGGSWWSSRAAAARSATWTSTPSAHTPAPCSPCSKADNRTCAACARARAPVAQ